MLEGGGVDAPCGFTLLSFHASPCSFVTTPSLSHARNTSDPQIQMQQMQQQVQQQMQQTQQMQQQMQQMQQQMQQMQKHQHVQQMNAWSYRPEDPVEYFPNHAMETAPACFPGTVEALETLSYPNCNICLQYYGVPRYGNVDERRHSLATHLGVRLRNNVFQALEERLDGSDRRQQRSEARQRNFATWHATDAIVPFPNDAGEPLPASFPETQQGLMDLPDQDLDELNSYYGIDGGDKRKLAHFLGVSSRNINLDQFG
jgi:type II secretory pathway component PulJ